MLRPCEISKIHFSEVVCNFSFSVWATSLEPSLPECLTGTGLKKAFPDLPPPNAGSTHPGNEDRKAGEQSVLHHSLE